MTLDLKKTGNMLCQLDRTRKIREQINSQENEARVLKQWLNENEEAPISERQDRQKQLLAALQKINDLVCELKPLPVYIIR